MSKECPLSSLDADQTLRMRFSDGNFLWEPYIPRECYDCIIEVRAERLGKTVVKNVPIDENEYTEDQNRYLDEGIKPVDSVRRVFISQSGYEDSVGDIETLDLVETTTFVCPKAAQ